MTRQEQLSVWVLGNQLLAEHPAIIQANNQTSKDRIVIVLIESQQVTQRLPYHRQKLVLMFSAMRHYAERLRLQGYTVDYIQADTFTAGLKQHLKTHNPATMLTMAATDYAGRAFQQDKLSDLLGISVEVLPNQQFLIHEYNPYPEPEPDKRYVMESFYRQMRKHFDVLMDDANSPTGGEWNYDKQNRKSLPADVDLPAMPQFELDDITQQVINEVAEMDGPVGNIDNFYYAVTHEQANAAFGAFIQHRLHDFGPYEDAMTERGGWLFHSVLSPYLNIGLLEPMPLILAAERAYHEGRAPINSVEGFIRQVFGWREFMYWQYWRQMPDLAEANHWDAIRPMPQMFWDGETEMNCIRQVVKRLQETAYSHHIERLMLVSNFCLMAGIDPQAVTDWFKVFYIDAYDWVMQPNVVGMGLNADGGIIATKPYIASANYINKMSDYCKGCRFNRKQRHGEGACPFNYLYWNFLLENEDALRANPRSGRNVLGLRHLDDNDRQQVRQSAQIFLDELAYYHD